MKLPVSIENYFTHENIFPAALMHGHVFNQQSVPLINLRQCLVSGIFDQPFLLKECLSKID